MNDDISFLMKLLGLSEDDVFRAVLSIYSPTQPGAICAAWKQRPGYGSSPTAKEVWAIYEKYDFKCAKCGSQYRIALDHINNDKADNKPENLQVLCQTCNRAKQKRGVKNRDTNLKIYKSLMEFRNVEGELPSAYKVNKNANIGRIGGSAGSLSKFLLIRLKQLKSK